MKFNTELERLGAAFLNSGSTPEFMTFECVLDK